MQRTPKATNVGKSKKEWMGVPLDALWIFLGGVMGTMMLLLVFYGMADMPLAKAVTWSLPPVYLAFLYVMLLRRNKPEKYDKDFIESVLSKCGLEEPTFGPALAPHTPHTSSKHPLLTENDHAKE